MAIDAGAVERMLLVSAVQSDCDLHAVIWDLNAQYPEERLAEKYGAADKALRALLERRWVSLCRVTLDGAKPGEVHVIDEGSTANILENPVSWYPSYKGIKIVFRVTETGRKAYGAGNLV